MDSANTLVKLLLLRAGWNVGLRTRTQTLILLRREASTLCQFDPLYHVAILINQRQSFLFVAHQSAIRRDIHFQQVHPLNASGWILGQQSSQQLLTIFSDWFFRRELELSFLEDLYQFGDGGGLEGTETVHHLIEDNSQGPNISLRTVNLPSKNLRGHVDG